MTALWPDAVVEEANLAYNVSAVRKALGDGQEGEQFIQTVPTRGYRFIAPVRFAFSRWRPSDRTAREVVRFELTSIPTSTLMTLDLATSQLARVSAVPAAFGATWGRDGRIYFAAGYSGLGMVPASGGAPQTVAKPRPGEGVHGLPELLPGGRDLLFTVWRLDDLDHAKVDILSLDTGERRTLLERALGARYLFTEHLSQSSLFGVGFDARTLELEGVPVPGHRPVFAPILSRASSITR
jgi:hypothetical protein